MDTDIKVDPRTGVPLNPEDILTPSGTLKVSQKRIGGVPAKVAIASTILTLLMPIAAFFLGSFLYPTGTEGGIFLAAWTAAVSFLTGRVIAWMLTK